MAAIRSVTWQKDAKEEFKRWLFEEIHQTLGDREQLVRKWKDDIIDWRARLLGDGVGDVPFMGASDIDWPIIAQHVEPVIADFIQTLHAPNDFWSFVGSRPDTVDLAKPLQEAVSAVEKRFIQMRKVNQKVFMDMIIHGTGIYKDRIDFKRLKQPSFAEVGDEWTPISSTTPVIERVPIQDFIIPAYAYDIDPDAPNGAAPWVSHRYYLRKEQLQAAATDDPNAPAWDREALKKVMQWEQDNEDDLKETHSRENRYQPFKDRVVTLHEVWARFDVDGDGYEEDVMVIWHHHTRQILRATHNPFRHGRRPFEAPTYLPTQGFYGMGMSEIDAWAQVTASRILNATIDSAVLNNAIMLGVPASIPVEPDEPIHPMKIWTLGPNDKLQDIQLGRGPSSAMLPLLQFFATASEQRSGVNELRTGDISQVPSRTPASGIQSLLQQSNKRFDMILGNLRDGPLRNLGVRLVQNLAQSASVDPGWAVFFNQSLGPEDAAKVMSVLQQPPEQLNDKFGITVTATSSQVNKETEKQSLTFLAQIMGQIYGQQIQYGQMLAQIGGDPSLLQSSLIAAYQGNVEIQKRLLEAHDIQNPDMYVPQPPPTPATPAGPQQPGMQPQQPGMAAPAPAGAGGPQAANPLAQAPDQMLQLLGLG